MTDASPALAVKCSACTEQVVDGRVTVEGKHYHLMCSPAQRWFCVGCEQAYGHGPDRAVKKLQRGYCAECWEVTLAEQRLRIARRQRDRKFDRLICMLVAVIHVNRPNGKRDAKEAPHIAFYQRLLETCAHPRAAFCTEKKHDKCAHGMPCCSVEKHALIAQGMPGESWRLTELRRRAMLVDGRCRCCQEAVT